MYEGLWIGNEDMCFHCPQWIHWYSFVTYLSYLQPVAHTQNQNLKYKTQKTVKQPKLPSSSHPNMPISIPKVQQQIIKQQP